MAFVVEDGTGLATATAYVSVATADAYHADRGNDDWDEADTDDQEQAIVRATDYLDQTFSWQGKRSTDTQALDWPRDAVFLLDGTEIDPDSIPTRLESACSEIALAALCLDIDPNYQGGGSTSQTKSAGGMSITQTLDRQRPVFHRAVKLIRELIAAQRLMRN